MAAKADYKICIRALFQKIDVRGRGRGERKAIGRRRNIFPCRFHLFMLGKGDFSIYAVQEIEISAFSKHDPKQTKVQAVRFFT